MDDKKMEALGHMGCLLSEALRKMELAAWMGEAVNLQEDDGINMESLRMVVKQVSELQQKTQAMHRAEFIGRMTVAK